MSLSCLQCKYQYQNLFFLQSVICYAPRAYLSESTFVPFMSGGEGCRHHAILVQSVTASSSWSSGDTMDLCVGSGEPAHFTTESLPSHRVADDRKRKVRPWSIRSDACWHHLHYAERQMARQGEKVCMSANCFLTLFWVCIGAQLGSWDHHRTKLEWWQCKADTKQPAHVHARKPERTWRHIRPSTMNVDTWDIYVALKFARWLILYLAEIESVIERLVGKKVKI